MAFIRQYMAESGDPFRFRLPRFLKPPKRIRGLLGKALKIAPFVPGLGALGVAGRVARLGRFGKLARGVSAARALRGRVAPWVARARQLRAAAAENEPPPGVIEGPEEIDEEEEEEPMYFSRGYGYEAGDPPKRKQAASGTKAKAGRKRQARAGKRAGTKDPRTGPEKRRPKGGARGGRVIGPDVAGGLADLLAQSGNVGLEALGRSAAGLGKRGRMDGLAGAARRHMNPTNVKALRRSLRRVESFAKLSRKVQKDASSILRHVDRPRTTGMTRRGGHKAGCGCVVCRRAA